MEAASPSELIRWLSASVGYSYHSDDRIRAQAYVLQDYVSVFLENLPVRDRAKAREVFEELTTSPIIGERQDASALMPEITAADHEFGLMLWRRLLTDPEAGVRGMAWEHLDTYLTASAGPGTGIDQIGLSMDDVRTLREAFDAAGAADQS